MNAKFRLLIILLISIVTANGYAAAFQLFEGNAQSVGDFGAGGAANLEDASATYFNPAALSQLKHAQIVSGAALLYSKIRYKGEVDVKVVAAGNIFDPESPSDPQQYSPPGGKKANTNQTILAPLPASYYAKPITDRLNFGIGLTVPFGLATDWSKNSLVRYNATKSSIMAFNLGPVFSYKLTPYWSLGGGVDLQYMQAEFDSMRYLVSTDGGDETERGDHSFANKADGFGYGWNVGTFVRFWQNRVRLGTHYRSRINHRLTGKSEYNGSYTPNNRITRVRTKITLPATLTIGGAVDLTEKWTVASTLYYTYWNSIKEFKLYNVSIPGGDQDIIYTQNFKNTTKIAVGSYYKLRENLTMRTAFGIDHTPTNNKDRNLRLPDSDRIALALGLRYAYSNRFIFDVGYTHLIIKEAKINYSHQTKIDLIKVKGTVRTTADIIAAQVTMNLA